MPGALSTPTRRRRHSGASAAIASATFSGRSPPARMIGVSPRIRVQLVRELRPTGARRPFRRARPGRTRRGARRRRRRSEFPTSFRQRVAGDANDRPDRGAGQPRERPRCARDRPRRGAERRRVARASTMRAISVGALVGEHADAPNARRNVPRDTSRARSGVSIRGPPAKITPTYAAPSDAANSASSGRVRPQNLMSTRHGRSSERPSIAQRLPRRQPPPRRRSRRAPRRRRGARRARRPLAPPRRSRRSR